MPITFACPLCSANLTVADENAGQADRCPCCQESIQVPAREGMMSAAAWATARAAATVKPFEPDADGQMIPDLRRRSRQSWIGIALGVLLALAAVGGLVYYLHEEPPPPLRSPVALEYLPDHFQIYFVGSYDRVTRTPAFLELEKLGKQMDDEGAANDVSKMLGIDVKNIRVVTGAFAVQSGRRSSSFGMSAVLETIEPIDTKKVRTQLRQHRFNDIQVGSRTVYVGGPAPSQFSICILSDRAILVGADDTVRTVLNRKRAAHVGDGMRAVMTQLDESKALAMVIDVKDLLSQRQVAQILNNLGEQGKKFLTELDTLFLYANMSDQVEIDVALICKSAETAEEMGKAGDGLLAMGRLMIPPNLPPRVTELLDAIKITADGNQVNGQWHIKLEGLLDVFKELQNLNP